jgi:myo-inositol-1(or 4)-monophosphatase
VTTSFDREAIIAIAQQGGRLIWQMRRAGLHNVKSKSVEIDIVTEADLACEAFLHAELHKLYPQVGFWGEESNTQPQGEFFWLADPVDGTVNYANGVAFYAVNLSLQWRDQTLLGVTVEPETGRIYWAELGTCAFVRSMDGTERRLQTSSVDQLSRALLTTGFPYHRADAADNNTREFVWFTQHCQGVRCMGSAALDLAHVASGAMAAFWEGWLNPWDAAPGVLLVREAGGTVTDYSGQPWTLQSQSLIASNGKIHAHLLEGVQTARATLPERRLPV